MITLVSYNRPRSEGLFVKFFADSLEEHGVEVRFFTVRNAMFGRLNVFNLHWPELVVRGSTVPKRIGKWVAVCVLLLRIRRGRIPVVHTVHNVKPHEGSRNFVESALQKLLLRSVTVRVYINESRENNYSLGPVILHGRFPRSEVDPNPKRDGGVLFFGRLRRYKGIEKLVGAYQSVDSEALPSLRIVGKAEDPAYEAELRTLTRRLKNVHLKAGFATDADLESMILSSKLVVLPYEQMYNSGVALQSLSLCRPILVPDSPANRALLYEFGPEWVHIFPSTEEGSRLARRIIGAHSASPSGEPDLSRRDWSDIAQLYSDLFRVLAVDEQGDWRQRLARDAWIRHSDLNRLVLDDVHGS